MPQIKLVYREDSAQMSWEDLKVIFRSVEDLRVKDVRFAENRFGPGWQCDVMCGESDGLTSDFDMIQSSTSDLTEEEERVFASIWRNLRECSGILLIGFHISTDDWLRSFYQVLLQIKDRYDAKVWMEDFLMDLPDERRFVAMYGSKRGSFGCFGVLALLSYLVVVWRLR